MHIDVLASKVSDNFFYVLHDDDGQAVVIDPIDGQQAVEHIDSRGYRLVHVINTHFHPDHIGGNPTVLRAFPEATLLAGAIDADIIDGKMADAGGPGVSRRLHDRDEVSWGGVTARVLDMPGHTAGHIGLLVETHLFCGDTIFVAGAGNCRFGGDAGQLFETFRNLFRHLPDEIVFYPGHDYALRNAEFVLSLEPEQAEAKAVLQEAKKAREHGLIMLSTLGRERMYNPFLRYDDPVIKRELHSAHGDELERQRALAKSEDEAVFRCLRALRNHW